MSPYFAGAFKGHRFEEGETQTITLKEDNLEAAHMGLFWVNYGFIPGFGFEVGPMRDGTAAVSLLMRVWSFGDKYTMPRLQNAAMTQ